MKNKMNKFFRRFAVLAAACALVVGIGVWSIGSVLQAGVSAPGTSVVEAKKNNKKKKNKQQQAKPAQEGEASAEQTPAVAVQEATVVKEEPKAEPVKEEPKAEEPKAEPVKEEPKAEEPKAEPAKEEPKAEEPKQEETEKEPAKEESPKTHKVAFYSNGEKLKETEVEHGKDAVPPKNVPAPEGMVFAGWDKEYENVTKDLKINAKFKAVAEPAAETAEQSVEEAPVKEAEAQPVEAAVEEQPAEEAVVEEQPAEEAVAEEQSVEEAVVEEQPAEEAVAEAQPAEEAVVEEQPAEEEAAEEELVLVGGNDDADAEDASYEGVHVGFRSNHKGEKVEEGTEIVLKANVSGLDGVDYKVTWQYTPDGGRTIIDAGNGSAHSFKANRENASWLWRVIVTVEKAA